MQIEILAVPGCPNRAAAVDAVRDALGALGRSDVVVVEREIADDRAAVESGMTGSPTILIDGVDPFAGDAFVPSLSCRLRPDDPYVDRILEVLSH